MTERPIGQPERRGRLTRLNSVESLPKPTIAFRISGVQKIFLDSIAELEGITPTQVMREAVDVYLEKKRLEYEDAGGSKEILAKNIEEVTVYSQGLKRAIDNLCSPKPPSN